MPALRRASRRARGPAIRSAPKLAEPGRLYSATDHGRPVLLAPDRFTPKQREGGWGPFAESFLRQNEAALSALDVRAEVSVGADGSILRLAPGGRAGAIPLRSAQTGHVVAGFVVRPRFGWAGVGSVFAETGWAAAPQFLELPLVPGSGREVPPWVLAGPVLARLEALLRSLRRGYEEKEALLRRPRGRILWGRYATEQLGRGHWDRLPCRYPDLDTDPRLKRTVRWALERIARDLVAVGGTDPVAASLAALALRLLERLPGVLPLIPRRDELRQALGGNQALGEALRRGIEAIAWIVDERGLGGGRELDGLAWQLELSRLWEGYVEAVVRRETAQVGGEVKSARLGQTTFPIRWSDPSHGSLGHLAPDLVIRRGRAVSIVDAKYKAHLAELDEHGWRQFVGDAREAHRADVHQALAYAALYDADELTATLAYPLRRETYDALRELGRDVSRASLTHGGRRVTVELRGLPFGAGAAR
ncbi:MAG: 5-methylcytosine restriction system specificity protein McrC [Deltaproteobacteria bacterium]